MSLGLRREAIPTKTKIIQVVGEIKTEKNPVSYRFLSVLFPSIVVGIGIGIGIGYGIWNTSNTIISPPPPLGPPQPPSPHSPQLLTPTLSSEQRYIIDQESTTISTEVTYSCTLYGLDVLAHQMKQFHRQCTSSYNDYSITTFSDETLDFTLFLDSISSLNFTQNVFVR